MRQALVAGNWKMNGSRASVAELVDGLTLGIDATPAKVVVCPPFVYLQEVAQGLAGSALQWGAQDVCEQPGPGALTGEISAAMLVDLGCSYTIVGHSERRTLYGEGDDLVARKSITAAAAGLTPIVGVGELLQQRETGETQAVIARQLDALLDSEEGVKALASAVIAYEPVWAIGTGKTATPEQAQEVHAFIRACIAQHDQGLADKLTILYGGSVKADNAADLFSMPDIDGGLIGGASLDVGAFITICQAAG